MSNKDNGGPAFPACNEANVNDTMGMTLRDYFAAKAMQAALPAIIAGKPADSETDNKLARASYMIADAMLEARK